MEETEIRVLLERQTVMLENLSKDMHEISHERIKPLEEKVEKLNKIQYTASVLLSIAIGLVSYFKGGHHSG